jgi:hypothetical protein
MKSWTQSNNIPRYNYAIQQHVDINGPEKDGVSIKQINLVHFPVDDSGIHYHLTLKGDSIASPDSDKARKQLTDIVKTYEGTISFNNRKLDANLPINWSAVSLEKRLEELEKGGFLAQGDSKKIADQLIEGINAKIAKDKHAKSQPGYQELQGSYIKVENNRANETLARSL